MSKVVRFGQRSFIFGAPGPIDFLPVAGSVEYKRERGITVDEMLFQHFSSLISSHQTS